ncbi:hypothetical protein Q3A68_15730 [Mucilaginibacter sp. BT774]|nr:hypothetical protein [Mucilaginibacter sp. BT774]
MDKERIINVIVDSAESNQAKNAFPDVNKILNETSSRIKQFTIDEIGDNLAFTVSSIKEMIQKIPNSENPKVTTITVSLAIEASGEVGLIGSLKGGLKSSSAITVSFDLK